MDSLYGLLTALGYPPEGIDWLRKRRLLVIVLLAIAAWALFIAAGWLVWSTLTRA